MESELASRSAETHLPVVVLRAVYLRGAVESSNVRSQTSVAELALKRVDEFICYALVRDTKFSRDRDLVPSAQSH